MARGDLSSGHQTTVHIPHIEIQWLRLIGVSMPKRIISGVFALSLAALLAACGSDISGVYVGTSPADAEMVQLVQAKDGKVTGRIEQALIKDDGTVSDQSVAVEGVVDGSQIVLTPKASLSDGSGSQTGLFRNNGLELSWSGGRRTLFKSTAESFSAEASKVRARAAQVVADRDTQAGLAILKGTENQMAAVTAAEPAIEQRLSAAEVRYTELHAALMSKRHDAVTRTSSPWSGLANERARNEAQFIQGQINDLHNQVEQAGFQLINGIKTIAIAMVPVRRSCAERPAALRNADFNSMCSQFENQKASMQDFAKKLDPAFSAAEVAYSRAIAPQ